MDTFPRKIEQVNVLVFVGTGDAKQAFATYRLLFDEIERHGIHDITSLAKTDAAALESALSASGNRLCIVIDYPFLDSEIAGMFARAVDKGLRLLVLDAGLENKTLAERLKIVNIKHKVRIEKMEFGNWGAEKAHLLSVILKDEFQQLKNG